MAKIPRVLQKIFGSSASAGQIEQFGSFAAGAKLASTDISVIQALSQWANGWFSAVIGNNSPTIEDMNAFFYVVSTQLAYILQAGVPEWETNTVYYIGSVVNSAGVFYTSLTDNNLGNAVSSTANWAKQVPKVTAIYTSNSGTTIVANTTNVEFTTVVTDPLGAWNGTVFTVPAGAGGVYQITGSVRTGSLDFQISTYVNSVQSRNIGGIPGVVNNIKSFSGTEKLNAGDTLSIRFDAGPTLSNVNGTIFHWISIVRLPS